MVKPSSIGDTKIYLGSNVGNFLYGNGFYAWTMSSNFCVKEVINSVKKRLKEEAMEYNKKHYVVSYYPKNPFSSVNYRPELDMSMECNEYQVSFYQNLILVLIWIIEIGLIEFEFEVSALSKHLGFPRTGHPVKALHIFKYLEINNVNDLAFNP